MSLLRDRINRDTREKERVEQKIQNVTVRPDRIWSGRLRIS